jgi:hypothetical protein
VKKNFKHLRKTYITHCYIQTSDNKEFMVKTGHTNMSTPLNHYIDMRTVMEARRKKLYDMKKNGEKEGSNDAENNPNIN